MLPRYRLRSFGACATILIATLFSMRPAIAASTLNAVRVDANPAGGALVSVTFAGGAPTFHVIGAGTSEVSVLLDGTTLGTQAPPSVAGAGPVTSVSVASTGTSASLALHLTGTSHVSVRTANNFLFVDVAASASPNLLNPFAPPPAATFTTGAGTVTVVVELKYADISEIAGVLAPSSTVASNDTFSPTQSNIGTSSLGSSFGGVGGGGGSTFGQSVTPQTFGGGFGQSTGLAQRVNDNIAVDRRLNAIILTGTPDVVAGLRETIEKLDVPVASVILETQIVELSDTAARNIGLDLSPDGSGIVANASASGVGYTSRSLNTAQGQVTFQANLYASVSEGNARIIAKPRILAQSGQPASILTGDAIPILTSVVITGSSATVSNQVSYVNVGVNLQIQPRVSSDGFVTSHIYSEVSSVTQITQGYPQISQRTASTVATVRDGEAFVIGGLLQDNEIKNLTKLPFIGDLPLIGSFFRHVTTSHTQDNLYIVVTPHIVGRSGLTPPIQPLTIPSALPQIGPPTSTLNPAPHAPPLTAPTSSPVTPASPRPVTLKMSAHVRRATFALFFALASACAPAVPPLHSPVRIDAYCGSKEARNTGIASVVSSTDDRLSDEKPTDTDVRTAVRSGDGVIAYWHDQPLALPRVAAALGESDGYARLQAAAIPPAPEGAQMRHIYLYVRDRGRERWIALAAYDMQNVCVEGKRES